MLYIILAILLVVIDQASKYLVRAHIPLGEHVPFLPGVMDFTYVQNTGAAFSALEEHTWLLTVMSAVVIGAMIVALVKKVFTHPLGLIPAVLVIAGGIGNLIDRALFGFVTDMFHTLFMNFAVFNVADIAITVGGFWLVAYVAFFYDKLEAKEAPADDDPADLPADGQ